MMTRESICAFLLGSFLFACSSNPGPSSPSTSDGGAVTGTTERDKATIEVGAQQVKARKCVNCHGDNMAGKMTSLPLPEGSDPRAELYPPNLTPDPATGIGEWGDEQLASAIRVGQDKEGLQLCPQMKHFSEMNDYEVYSIVKYLRSIPAVVQDVPRSVCPPLKTKDEQ